MTVFDLTDLTLPFDERDAQLLHLREHNPVAWDEENEWWLVTRHADITTVSRDTTTFSSADGVTYFATIPLSMITADPPEHTRLRRLVSRQFTPRMVGQLRDLARERTEQGVMEMIAAGGGDYVEHVAVPVTLTVIMKMLGIGVDCLAEIREWSDSMMAASGRLHIPGVLEKSIEGAGAWRAHIDGHIEEKRARPTDDLLSLIATDPDEPMNMEELHTFALLLMVAGNETTRHTSSFGIDLLARHPDQAAAVRADPDGLMASTVNEVLRFASVVRSMTRTATVDVELGGASVKAGDKLNLMYPSANRDADVFERPFDFDVTRDPNPHLAFGIGTHYCLGANLAQLQLDVMFRAWLDRVGDWTVHRLERFDTGLVSGVERLDITINA